MDDRPSDYRADKLGNVVLRFREWVAMKEGRCFIIPSSPVYQMLGIYIIFPVQFHATSSSFYRSATVQDIFQNKCKMDNPAEEKTRKSQY